MRKLKVKILNLVDHNEIWKINPNLKFLLEKKLVDGGNRFDQVQIAKTVMEAFEDYTKVREGKLSEVATEKEYVDIKGETKKTKLILEDLLFDVETKQPVYRLTHVNDRTDSITLIADGTPVDYNSVYPDGVLDPKYVECKSEVARFDVADDKQKELSEFQTDLIQKDVELNAYPLSLKDFKLKEDCSDIDFFVLDIFFYDDRYK